MKRPINIFLLCIIVATGSILTVGNAKTRKAKKASSGIKGEVVRVGFPPMNPDECPECPWPGTRILIPDWAVVVRHASDAREVRRMKTDKNGKFKVTLPAGKYLVVADPNYRGYVENFEQVVIVQPNKFKYVWVAFDDGW